MKKATITLFVVTADLDYESAPPVAVFPIRDLADTFVKTCREYDTTYPQCPELKDPDSVWEKYYKAEKKWVRLHPAGNISGPRDSYSVWSLPLREGAS